MLCPCSDAAMTPRTGPHCANCCAASPNPTDKGAWGFFDIAEVAFGAVVREFVAPPTLPSERKITQSWERAHSWRGLVTEFLTSTCGVEARRSFEERCEPLHAGHSAWGLRSLRLRPGPFFHRLPISNPCPCQAMTANMQVSPIIHPFGFGCPHSIIPRIWKDAEERSAAVVSG